MEYKCRHCSANLDDGDIFEYFLVQFADPIKAAERASLFGWTPKNRIHFYRSISVRQSNIYGGVQCTICPDCKGRDPLVYDLSSA